MNQAASPADGLTAWDRRLLWLCAAVVVMLVSVIAFIVAPLQPGVLVLQFAWTPRGFGEIVHVWPAEHLARYRAHLPLDCALLLAYGAFGWLLATRSRLFSSLPRAVRVAVPFVLPLAAVFDAVENGLHWWLTEIPRFGMPSIYLTSTVCSTLKWLLLILFGALTLWALAVEDGRRR